MHVQLEDNPMTLHGLRSKPVSEPLIRPSPPSPSPRLLGPPYAQLEGNPLTLHGLRSTPGFGAFDERRKSKCEKQMDGGAMFDANRCVWGGGGGD